MVPMSEIIFFVVVGVITIAVDILLFVLVSDGFLRHLFMLCSVNSM